MPFHADTSGAHGILDNGSNPFDGNTVCCPLPFLSFSPARHSHTLRCAVPFPTSGHLSLSSPCYPTPPHPWQSDGHAKRSVVVGPSANGFDRQRWRGRHTGFTYSSSAPQTTTDDDERSLPSSSPHNEDEEDDDSSSNENSLLDEDEAWDEDEDSEDSSSS